MARRKETAAQRWRKAVLEGRVVRYHDRETRAILSHVSYPNHEMMDAAIAAKPADVVAEIVSSDA